MPENIIVKLTDTETIDGDYPIVVIGPNGSGKTRFAAQLATRNNAEFLGALRNIAMEENIPMQGLDQAKNQLTNSFNRHRSNYWLMSNEINDLFSKLMAEDAASAMRFRDQHATGKSAEIEETNLMRLRAAWADFFPGRYIDFTSYKARVTSDYDPANTQYPANRMSDGERVALYLGARVLNAQSNIVIIDEPEVHFHSRLAVRFWNKLEGLRPDVRFVYVTHDLTFALSRQSAQYVIVKPNSAPELIPLDAEVTRSLAESILGAASFSIYAQRIVFCEGEEGDSGDHSLYSSWFKGFGTAVIPVGTCKDVVQCTQAFGTGQLIVGVSAIGIIDRDYWPDRYLTSLHSSVFVLPTHEIENLFCLRGVFEAVGRHLSFDTTRVSDLYADFISNAKGRFMGGLLAKQISERFKRRCEGGLSAVVNGLRATDDLSMLQSEYVSALQPSNWDFDPETIFTEERQCLEKALLSPNEEAFLRLFPGKVCLPIAARTLGIEPVRYRELVATALREGQDESLSILGHDLETALSEVLPPRETQGTV